MLVALLQVEELVDAVELDSLVVDLARDDRTQLQLRPGDDAGQAHPADRRGVPLGVLGRRTESAAAVRAHQLEAGNVVAKGARSLMVLAVDVVGNGATERNVLRPRSDRQKEAARHREVENLCQRDAGLGGQDAGLGVEVEQAVHARRLQQVAVFQQANVAVAAAQSHRQRAAAQPSHHTGKVALPVEGDEFRVVLGIPSP